MDSAGDTEKQAVEPEQVSNFKVVCLYVIGRGRGGGVLPVDRWYYQCRNCGREQTALYFPS
jgi:hypothetical protein